MHTDIRTTMQGVANLNLKIDALHANQETILERLNNPARPTVNQELTEQQLSQLGQQLYEQMKSDPAFRGQQGTPGINGLNGQDGRPGSIDQAKLLALIRKSLPDVTVDVVLPDGRIARQTESLADGNAKFEFRFDPGNFQVGSRGN